MNKNYLILSIILFIILIGVGFAIVINNGNNNTIKTTKTTIKII